MTIIKTKGAIDKVALRRHQLNKLNSHRGYLLQYYNLFKSFEKKGEKAPV